MNFVKAAIDYLQYEKTVLSSSHTTFLLVDGPDGDRREGFIFLPVLGAARLR